MCIFTKYEIKTLILTDVLLLTSKTRKQIPKAILLIHQETPSDNDQAISDVITNLAYNNIPAFHIDEFTSQSADDVTRRLCELAVTPTTTRLREFCVTNFEYFYRYYDYEN